MSFFLFFSRKIRIVAETVEVTEDRRRDKFLCDICGKLYQTKHGLLYHQATIHKVDALHCSLCPKTFLFKSVLQDHLDSHHGQKSHQCDECGATFADRRKVRVHKKGALVHKKIGSAKEYSSSIGEIVCYVNIEILKTKIFTKKRKCASDYVFVP